MKKIFFVLVIMAVIFILLVGTPYVYAYDKFVYEDVNENEYSKELYFNANGIIITKYIGNKTEIVIPEEIDGKPVVCLTTGFFSSCCNVGVQDIEIPNSVERIITTSPHIIASGDILEKYYKKGIPFLETYEGLTYIDEWLVGINDTQLENLVIREGTKGIVDKLCFYLDTASKGEDLTSNIKTIYIPSTVKIIPKRAFYGQYLTNLNAVIISDGVQRIEEESFYGCKALKTVILPESVNYVSENAFSFCNNLSEESITSIFNKE